MTDHLGGPPEPAPAPVSGEADTIRHVGGPWFEVDTDGGPERVRGREAAERVAAGVELPPEPQNATEEAAGSTRFRGPALEYVLPCDVVTGSVTVHDGERRIPISVSGRTVTRRSGHFGRGVWTVTYKSA